MAILITVGEHTYPCHETLIINHILSADIPFRFQVGVTEDDRKAGDEINLSTTGINPFTEDRIVLEAPTGDDPLVYLLDSTSGLPVGDHMITLFHNGFQNICTLKLSVIAVAAVTATPTPPPAAETPPADTTAVPPPTDLPRDRARRPDPAPDPAPVVAPQENPWMKWLRSVASWALILTAILILICSGIFGLGAMTVGIDTYHFLKKAVVEEVQDDTVTPSIPEEKTAEPLPPMEGTPRVTVAEPGPA